MSFGTRIKAAYQALFGGNDGQGFVPVVNDGVAGNIKYSGGDEKWLGISAYFACLRNISEDVGKLPLITYEHVEKGKEKAKDHINYDLLKNTAHPIISSTALRETVTRFALGWGNGYARINRRMNGEVFSLEPVHPLYVEFRVSTNGVYGYAVSEPGMKEMFIPAEDMIHIHGVASNGINGLSVAAYARETLDFSAKAQKYGHNLYGRGGRPGGTLTHPGVLKDDAKRNLKDSWEQAYGGDNVGRTAILDRGIKYEAMTISPIDAQYLETRQFSVEEIARWFRMPLHKIQYLVRAQGWSTLDAQNTDYLIDTLLPWINRWEIEINRKLFAGDPDHFAEHLLLGILRGDQKSRSEFYTKMFAIGALSINEIRDRENMNHINDEAGNKHYIPLNMAPAELAKKIGVKDDE